MGFKHFVGSSFDWNLELLLSSRWFPLTRYFPRGVNWLYDVQRFAATRDLPIIFDVGANIGQTARALAKFFPASSIYCFEPVADTFQKLNMTFKNNFNITCIQSALGNVASLAEIALYEESELNTLVLGGPRTGLGKTEIIAVDTVDEFCRARGLDRIDLLKLDVQGWELSVIQGAQSMLGDNAVRFIFSEVAFRRSDIDMQHFGPFNDMMESCGFMFCGFYESFRYGPAKQFVNFSNALYLNPRFKARHRN
jgi:FkbM family methyltransferase